MDVQPVFGTPMLSAAIPQPTRLNGEIRDRIAAASAAPTQGEVPGGGWRSGIQHSAWAGAAGNAIIDTAVSLARQHSVDVGGSGQVNRFDWGSRIEGILLPPGARTLPAFAPLAFWSTIYCVESGLEGGADQGLGGEIEFEDPRAPFVMMEAPRLRFAKGRGAPCEEHFARVRPRAGDLIMFPGWLRRAHLPNRGRCPQTFLHIEIVATPRSDS